MSLEEETVPQRTASRAEGIRQRRNRIVDAAAWLLIHAPDSFSMRNLARKADLSVRTIYNIVGDQTAVLMEIVNRPSLDIMERVEDLGTASPLERLWLEVQISQETLNSDVEAIHASVRALRQLGAGAIWQRVDVITTARYRPQFEAAAAAGELRPGFPIDAMTCQLATALSGALHGWAENTMDFAGFSRRAIGTLAMVIVAAATDDHRPRWETLLRNLLS